ncbi:unnamed protein product [Paramecium sonneborni]|uniref:Uncharacterized protein n=1 Tax=Paramecium sonneborni TaxID=65129 RepID=A0A8S1RQV2_9CILI|nr:unnamed protein product [Paramecium sonneborni]
MYQNKKNVFFIIVVRDHMTKKVIRKRLVNGQNQLKDLIFINKSPILENIMRKGQKQVYGCKCMKGMKKGGQWKCDLEKYKIIQYQHKLIIYCYKIKISLIIIKYRRLFSTY